MYVAVKDSLFQNLLLEHDVVNELMAYDLAYVEFNDRPFIYGIDSVDPESNVDFVHFVWDNSENFSLLSHSINLLPTALNSRRSTSLITGLRTTGGTTRVGLLCVRAISDRISIPSRTIANPRPLSMFHMSTTSPSLAAIAANIIFRYKFNLNLFPLRQSLRICRPLHRIPPYHLRPLSFPKICIMYSSDQPRLRLHYHCHGAGKWHGANTVMFNTPPEAIAVLVKYKDPF